MALAIKLDEDLPYSLATDLAGLGYDTASVYSQGWSGMKDGDLWPRLQTEKRFLITADKGFGDIRKFPPGSHAGVLLHRPDRESAKGFKELLLGMLSKTSLDSLSGCVAVLSSSGLRVRKVV